MIDPPLFWPAADSVFRPRYPFSHRALLAILRSEVRKREHRSPEVGGAAATPTPTTPSQGPNPALSVTPLSRNAAATAAGAAAAALDGAFAATVATNPPSAQVGVIEVADNPSSDETLPRAAGAPSPSTPALESSRAAHGAPGAGATIPGAEAASAADGEGTGAGGGGSSAPGEGGEAEKKALETAWNLYLQVTHGDESASTAVFVCVCF